MEFYRIKKAVKTALSKQSLVQFFSKNGFYVILFVCVFIIVVTAIWTSTRELCENDMRTPDVSDEEPENTTIKEEIAEEDAIEITVTDVSDVKNREDEKKTDASPKKKSDLARISPEAQPAAAVESLKTGTDLLMCMPVEGKILKDFADEKLLYSRTLKEWTTHLGIDIEAPLGSEVKAALDGTVEKIEEDALTGIVITLDHGNGLKTRYINLSTKEMVQPGQKVKKGEVISGVGQTALFEIADPPHLHFEVLIDGKNVDPKEYLK